MAVTEAEDKTVHKALRKIAKGELENFKVFRKKGELVAEEILSALQSNGSSYKIDRVRIASSIGNRTSKSKEAEERTASFGQPDFDLVIWITQKQPFFILVLQDFETCLRKAYGRKSEFYIKKAQFSIQLKIPFEGETISVEILPATNQLQVKHNSQAKDSREKIQAERVLKIISQLPGRKGYFATCYHASVYDPTISFVEGQSPFVHEVIRLAKLWNRKVTWEEESESQGKSQGQDQSQQLRERSMIIDLIAIHGSIKVERYTKLKAPPSEKLAEAFQLFLKKFIDFDKNMAVYFEFETNQNQEIVYMTYEYLTKPPKTPLILDPFNPFNNFATRVTPPMKAAFESHAKRTLEAIENYGVSGCNLEDCFDLQLDT